MDSDANQKLCDEVHRPAAPFAFFPYINLRDPMTGQVQQAISGDGVIEGHVAGRLGLLGSGSSGSLRLYDCGARCAVPV